VEPFIVGGQEVKAHMFPWMGALLYEDEFIGSAFLISDEWAITAAHLVNGFTKKHSILFGAHNLNAWTETERRKVQVEKIIIHEDWDFPHNDIALLKLVYKQDFSDYIRPICLPTMEDVKNAFQGTDATVIGWGKTEEIFHTNEEGKPIKINDGKPIKIPHVNTVQFGGPIIEPVPVTNNKPIKIPHVPTVQFGGPIIEPVPVTNGKPIKIPHVNTVQFEDGKPIKIENGKPIKIVAVPAGCPALPNPLPNCFRKDDDLCSIKAQNCSENEICCPTMCLGTKCVPKPKPEQFEEGKPIKINAGKPIKIPHVPTVQFEDGKPIKIENGKPIKIVDVPARCPALRYDLPHILIKDVERCSIATQNCPTENSICCPTLGGGTHCIPTGPPPPPPAGCPALPFPLPNCFRKDADLCTIGTNEGCPTDSTCCPTMCLGTQCIPTGPSPPPEVADGKDALRKVAVTTLKKEEEVEFCDDKYPSVICTNNKQGTEGFCYGDNGAPLMIKKPNGRWTAIGAASFVINGCQSGDPNGFTRLTANLDWIAKKTGIEIPHVEFF
jgi:nucleoid DNA-binding protein